MPCTCEALGRRSKFELQGGPLIFITVRGLGGLVKQSACWIVDPIFYPRVECRSVITFRVLGRQGSLNLCLEMRVRGFTTHSRRDPRNAKGVGRTVWDPFCTGALEVGLKVSGAAARWLLSLGAGKG